MCLCKCSALVKLRPHLSAWQTNLFSPFLLKPSFLFRPRGMVEVVVVAMMGARALADLVERGKLGDAEMV